MAIKAGSAYVELTLNDKVYKEKLSGVLTSTEATAKGIETSWRTLGTKADATFDAQRRSYENAMTLIKNSTTATHSDIIRAEQAKNAKIQALNDAQFGKQTSALDAMKGHYLAITAAVAISIGAISKAWDLAKIGADYAEQRSILDNLSTKYGSTADSIVASMEVMSTGLISRADLMQTALKGIAKGLTPEQLNNLAGAADILADVTGGRATDALNDMTTALATGKLKGLKPYGDATIDLGVAFGDLESKLTDAEKAQATYGLIMMKVTELQSQQKKEVSETADNMDRSKASFENGKLMFAGWAANVVGGAYNVVTALQSVRAAWGTSQAEQNKINAAYIALGKSTVDYKDAMYDEKAAVESLKSPYQEQIDSLKKQLKARKDNDQATKDAAAEAKKQADYYKHLEEQSVKDYLKGIDDEIEIQENFYRDQAKQATKAYKDKEDAALEFKKLVSDEYEFAATENERAINKIIHQEREKVDKVNEILALGAISFQTAEDAKAQIHKNAAAAIIEKERTDARTIAGIESSIFSAAPGYGEEAYAAKLKLITIDAEEMLASGVSWDAAYAMIKTKTDAAKIDLGKTGNSLTGGIEAALVELGAKNTGWGSVGYELTKSFTGGVEKQLADNFVSIFTGKFDQVTIKWDALWLGMVTTLSKKLSEMVVEAAAKQILLSFGASWTDAAMSIIGTVARIAGGALETWWGEQGSLGDSRAVIKGDKRATGGPVSANNPYWVGEKGPELLFPGGPGYVMEHNRSVAYAAKNGGYIPGREDGGGVDQFDPSYDPFANMANLGNISNEDFYNLLTRGLLPKGISTFYGGGAVYQIEADGGYLRSVTTGGGGGFGFGLGSFLDLLTGISTGGGSWAGTAITGGTSLGDFMKNGGGSIYDWIHAIADPSGAVTGSAKIVGANSPPWVTQIANLVAPVIGGIIGGPGGAAAGSGIMADWNAGAIGGDADRQQAMMNAGIAAVLAWCAGEFGPKVGSGDFNPTTGEEIMVPWGQGVGTTFSETALETTKNYAKRWGINQALGAMFPAENGGLNFSYGGANDNGLTGSLSASMRGIAPRSDSIPMYENGIDYVPRTGPAILHKGERVQSADDAANGRVIHTHVYLDRREIALAIADEVERTPRLQRRLTGRAN
jgi:hypothetical protein